MKSKKILIVDDDEAILELMRFILESEGYDVLLSTDGRLIKKMLADLPDLVFLDLHLSGSNGAHLCHEIKQPGKKHPPVIIVSASNETKNVAQECGADDYLLKPFDLADLISLAQKYLPLEE